jgi:hypothetical protein
VLHLSVSHVTTWKSFEALLVTGKSAVAITAEQEEQEGIASMA